MKERPILFNPHEVINTLDGRQTQFRRVVKNRSNCPDFYAHRPDDPCHPYPYYFRRADAVWDSFKTIEELAAKYCPFGQVGDHLWVRESFTYWEDDEFGGDYLEYRTGHRRSLGDWEHPHPIYDHCIGRFGKWTSPVAMPRWASRIILENTGVRIERLQDISEEDAIAEGIIELANREFSLNGGQFRANYAVGSFRQLWDSINKKHPWANNPWVWVVDFKLAKSTMAIAAKEECQ